MIGLLLLAASIAQATASAAPSYDFFLLVLQYAPALCGAAMKCPGVTPSWTYFTLHGLWPENNDGTYPQTCSNAKFDPTAVSSITTQLNKYWVSLSGPSETFWAHEYEKHGTCAADVYPTELSFMNSTLGLRDVYDITPALAAAGLAPSATATFTQAQFQAAVTKAFGFPALLSCTADGNIDGAVVCISKKGRAQSCGSVKYGSCSSNVLRLLPPK